MIEAGGAPDFADSIEFAFHEELARSDATLGSAAPILRHLLVSDDTSLFGEEIVARVRGMIADVARQLLDALAGRISGTDEAGPSSDEIDALSASLAGIHAFLGHIHALALEWQLTERLQSRLSIDPVLSPLLQALIASSDTTKSSIAMNLLASQARFCQAQRRMKLPLGELPGDLLHAALLAMRAHAEPESDALAVAAEASIRAGYDEAGTRLGLLSRVITGMGSGAIAALSVSHAGAAIFLTALSLSAGQDRDATIFAASESQMIRLALAMRAAGLKAEAVEEQLIALHPELPPLAGLDRIAPDRAAALLARSGAYRDHGA